jgi:hypothetical protein
MMTVRTSESTCPPNLDARSDSLDKFRGQNDGKVLGVTIDTQETLTPETMAKLFALKDQLGWFFFAESRQKLPDAIDGEKSPQPATARGPLRLLAAAGQRRRL